MSTFSWTIIELTHCTFYLKGQLSHKKNKIVQCLGLLLGREMRSEIKGQSLITN
jgi:hypothetical protein